MLGSVQNLVAARRQLEGSALITAAQVDELLDVVDDSLTVVEREFGLR